MEYKPVITFWFEEISPKAWWQKDAAFDTLIRDRFGPIHAAAIAGELYVWRQEPLGRLAEVIVLDQFSRNIYRDRPESFLFDGMALVLAQEAVAVNVQAYLTPQQKSFLYMPFMHSESPVIHQTAVELYSEAGLEWNLEFELKHKAIIDRFGRYPHRNTLLGRTSTPEELVFLQEPGSSF